MLFPVTFVNKKIWWYVIFIGYRFNVLLLQKSSQSFKNSPIVKITATNRG